MSSHNSPFIFGGNVFGWTVNEERSFDLLDYAVDHGITALDTADVYTRLEQGFVGGESETVIGNWLRKRKNTSSIHISTKCGLEMGEGMKGLSASYISKAVDASLTRLGVDYIDVYYAHWEDLETPIEETIDAFKKLVKMGKIGQIGLCNFSPDGFRTALETAQKLECPFSAAQFNYNLCDRSEFEKTFAPLCKAQNIQTYSFFSLASGFLSGRYRTIDDIKDKRRAFWLKNYMTPQGFAILDIVDEIAQSHAATPSQIALAWIFHKTDISAPIVSATSKEQFDQLLGATEIKLTDDQITKLDLVSTPL